MLTQLSLFQPPPGRHDILRLGDPELNLNQPLLMGRGATQGAPKQTSILLMEEIGPSQFGHEKPIKACQELKQTSHKTSTGFLAIMAHLRYTLYLSLFCHLNHCPAHPGRSIIAPKMPQMNRKIIFPTHFWVPAVNIPGPSVPQNCWPRQPSCVGFWPRTKRSFSPGHRSETRDMDLVKPGQLTKRVLSHGNLTVALANMHW